MTVLIKGINVHRGRCYECPCLDGEYGDCNVLEKDVHYITKEECPIMEIPDHGDLIDREALNVTDSWEWIRHLAPVVVPAERSEDE